jgi:hypothetical protein
MGQLHWMFSLIPDDFLVWVYYLLTGAGVALYIASKLVNLIPMMGQYKFPVELVGVTILVAGSYLLGGYGTEMSWRERVKELQAKVVEAEQKSEKVNTIIQTKVVTKIQVVEKQVEVVRTQIQKDKEIINADCKIPDIAIIDYNKAIADPSEEKK